MGKMFKLQKCECCLILKNIQKDVNFKDFGLNTQIESGDWIK